MKIETIKQLTIKYPVIFTEYNDESGHYYVVTSPNLPGLVADGKTINEALDDAKDAALCLLEGETYPKVQDSQEWQLKNNQQIKWLTIPLP